jgi:hypothetical protein
MSWPHTGMSDRRLARAARLAALLILTLSVLPNVSYLGHWSLSLPGHEELKTPADAAEHASHCHLGPSNCSGLGSAAPEARQADPELVPDLHGALFGADARPEPVTHQSPVFHLKPPPRSA